MGSELESRIKLHQRFTLGPGIGGAYSLRVNEWSATYPPWLFARPKNGTNCPRLDSSLCHTTSFVEAATQETFLERLQMLTQTTNGPRHLGGRINSLAPKGTMAPYVLVTSLLFLWGLPNNLNVVLIRQFMKSFQPSRFQAGPIQSAFYCGYFVLATPAALIMRRFGYKADIITGRCLLGIGTFLLWPAAIVGDSSFFLPALFVIAGGLSFLETMSATAKTEMTRNKGVHGPKFLNVILVHDDQEVLAKPDARHLSSRVARDRRIESPPVQPNSFIQTVLRLVNVAVCASRSSMVKLDRSGWVY